jgi:hypothetical protein
MMLPTFSPMLASTHPPRDPTEWAFEAEALGLRALVYVDGSVRVRTRRRGRNVT